MPTPITELDLSIRAYKRLRGAGVETLEELANWPAERLLALPGFGQRSLTEVIEHLREAGLELTPTVRVLDPRPGIRADLSTSARKQIVDRYVAGEPVRALSREFGLSPTSIYQWADTFADGFRKLKRHQSEEKRPAKRSDRQRHWLNGHRIRRNYLTAPDAADLLGISRFTMHEYLKAGKFPGAFQLGKQGWWLVPRAAVEARKKGKA